MSNISVKLGIRILYCFYCGKKLSRKNHSIDHKIPLSKGGSDKSHNKVHACMQCNTDKGCLTLDEFRAVWAYRAWLKLKTKNKTIKLFTYRFPGEIKTKKK